MNRLLFAAVLIFSAQIQHTALRATEWADLRVKVVYDGPPRQAAALLPPMGPAGQVLDERMIVGKNGELANFAIIMDMRKSKANDIHPSLTSPPTKPLEIVSRNGAFKPHVAFAQTGRQVIVKNNDPYGHNFKIDPFSNDSVSSLVPIGGQIEVEFRDSERSNFTEFTCTVHPWMKGQLIIRDHPYVGISRTNGVVTIEKLPVGNVTFKLVHENMKKSISEGKLDGKPAKWRSGYIELDLQAGLNEHTITLDPDLFED